MRTAIYTTLLLWLAVAEARTAARMLHASGGAPQHASEQAHPQQDDEGDHHDHDGDYPEPKKAKKVVRSSGGLPRAFDQVWTDATKVSRSHLRTDCRKPRKKEKKEKKDSDYNGGEEKTRRYDESSFGAPAPSPRDDPVGRPVFMPSPIADDPVNRPVFMPSPIADDPVNRPVFMPSPIADDPVNRPTVPDGTTTRTYTHAHGHIHWVDGVRHYHHKHPHSHTYVVGTPHYHYYDQDPLDRDECGGDEPDYYYNPSDNYSNPTPYPAPVSPPMPSPIADDPVSRPVFMPSPIADDPVSRPVFMPSPIADDPVSRPVFMPSPIADDPVSRPVFMPSPIADDPIARPTVNVVENPPTASNVVEPGTPTGGVPTGGIPSAGGTDDAIPSPFDDDDTVANIPSNGGDPMTPTGSVPTIPSNGGGGDPMAPVSGSVPTVPSNGGGGDPTIPSGGDPASPTGGDPAIPTAGSGGDPMTPSVGSGGDPSPSVGSGGDPSPSGGTGGDPAAGSDPTNGGVIDPPPPSALTIEEICAGYMDGTAPTTGNREEHSIFVTLNVDAAVDEQVVLEDLSRALYNSVGPSVLGCSTRRFLKQGQRNLQATQMTNILFAPPIRDAPATCAQAVADSKCIPVQVDATIFYTGTEPPNAAGKIRQALFLLPAGSITGFQGWGEIAVLPPGQEPGAPTTNTGRGIGSDSDENKAGRSPNSIAFVAAAAGSLVVILTALFLIRKRRKKSEEADKIREFTDEEEDLGVETNDESYDDGLHEEQAAVPKQAYVLNDEFSTQESANGHEVFNNVHHGPYETCSSPSCEMCETKRREGTRFIVTTSFEDRQRRRTSSSRQYSADDTVQL